MKKPRQAQKVLVMLDYGPDDPASGEVFDVTAIARELAQADPNHRARISLNIDCDKDWFTTPSTIKTVAQWSANMGFEWYPHTDYLDDAINAAMAGNPEVQRIQKRIAKLKKLTDKLEVQAKFEQLKAAADMRSTHPIARVTTAQPLAIAGPTPEHP